VSDDRYERWVRSQVYREERPQKARVIAALCGDAIRGAERVADLGAGTGIIKKELEVITDRHIVGFDIDTSFVVQPERMVAADALRLPVAEATFDFVVLNHVYEHVEDQAGLFRELHRVLASGGEAYVSAGNRLAVLEPHYRLPFLSWLPSGLADLYVRLSGRGRAYRDIRFLTYGRLTRLMRRAGLRIRDDTRTALDRELERAWGGIWSRLWSAARRLPDGWVDAMLRALSPQWFFRVTRPEVSGEAGARERKRTEAESGREASG
jgi:SAM-dependent methyltransferase